MDEHRLTPAITISSPIRFYYPFSSFQYVDANYGGGHNPAVRRLFSLARSFNASTLIVEKIEPTGIIADENEEIKRYYSDYHMGGLDRISFWSTNFDNSSTTNFCGETCIGYAILKQDVVPSIDHNWWHIFEAVFRKYPHVHNCCSRPMKYKVMLVKELIDIEGLLYAQQNGLNKACAQVALRSLISRINQGDVSYNKINEYAGSSSPRFRPKEGLTAQQIQSVLNSFGIRFRDFDYTQHNQAYREDNPYRKYIYSGVESGAGALLGFRLSGLGITDHACHIIPFYGHTFNKDTWTPDADRNYFRIGKGWQYVQSENWTSSFLGHDDNFGPNFCVPRLYVPTANVEYVNELLYPGIVFSGVQAEALSLTSLYSALDWINAHQGEVANNVWLDRLTAMVGEYKIVLRSVSVDRDTYIQHLFKERDSDDNGENPQTIKAFGKRLPNKLWITEVSIPQLFPANERKLGDIVLNGGIELKGKSLDRPFLFVRLPGMYLLKSATNTFLNVPSGIKSHISVIHL
ncbi:MAG: hypothetical protein ACYDHZ_01060 [Dehalococcoidia bacterium]